MLTPSLLLLSRAMSTFGCIAQLYKQPSWSTPQQMFPEGPLYATVEQLTSARTWGRPHTAVATTTTSTTSSLTRTRSSARDELNVPSQAHYPHFTRRGRAQANYDVPLGREAIPFSYRDSVSRGGAPRTHTSSGRTTSSPSPSPLEFGVGTPSTPSLRTMRLEAARAKRGALYSGSGSGGFGSGMSTLKDSGLSPSSMRSTEDLGSVAAIGFGEKAYYLR